MLAVKRKVIEAALVIVFFLLETTIFSYLELASIKPNLLIILTAAFGFMQGKKEGMFVGVLSGFLLDISFGQYIGFYILLYTVIGYANGFFQKLYYDENIKLPLLLIGEVSWYMEYWSTFSSSCSRVISIFFTISGMSSFRRCSIQSLSP